MVNVSIKENILKEDEFQPPLISEPSPIEIPKIETFPEERSRVSIPLNEEFEKEFEGLKEGIIIDPLAFYVPYHFNTRLWGIYFRVNEINKDFSNFFPRVASKIRLPTKQLTCLCFAPYIRIIFLHELCHHVLEDIATISEEYSKIRYYPFLIRNEEEGLCEYIAFTQQIKSRFPLSIPSRVLKNAFPSFSVPLSFLRNLNKKAMDAINLIVVSELYYHWNRANDPIYKPKIYPHVGVKVGPLWQSFWRCHRNIWNVIKIVGVKVSEVYDRLFLTYH